MHTPHPHPQAQGGKRTSPKSVAQTATLRCLCIRNEWIHLCELLAFSGQAGCLWAQSPKPSWADQICPNAKGLSPVPHSASWWPPSPSLMDPSHHPGGDPFFHVLIKDVAVSQCVLFSGLFTQLSKCFLGFPCAWPSAELWGPDTRRITHHFQRTSGA